MIYTILGWILLSLLIGFMGDDKKIGFGGGFLISLFLSPLIGAIFVATSEKKFKADKNLIKLNQKAISQKSKDLDKGIEILKKGLLINPKSPRTNYNIACFYSLKKDKENAFLHLSKSVKNGFNDFTQISKDRDLSWLRSQDEYTEFVENDFNLIVSEKLNSIQEQEPNYIQEIRELKKLYDDGILTESEYSQKKSEILNLNN